MIRLTGDGTRRGSVIRFNAILEAGNILCDKKPCKINMPRLFGKLLSGFMILLNILLLANLKH
jgi:hypothetical protein